MKAPYLRMDELAEEYRFTVRSGPRKGALDVPGARKWAMKHLTVYRRGRALLVKRDDVEAALVKQEPAA